ncbi:MAG: AEC family transporter [Alphaproteobacteria bacterium]|nr:AEC family transporter [Rhodospirillales bacterium]MCW9045130.1 AEC family transporter [Alphaproteobacteria bacterium]
MLYQLFSVVAPIFICAGIGYGWARSGRSYDTEMVTTMVTLIGVPCLVFSALTKVDLDRTVLADMALYSTVSLAAFGIIGYVIVKVSGANIRAYLPCLMFPNTGNMGLPLCLLAFGDVGLALAVVYFTMAALTQFTIGQAISSGQTSFKDLARSPLNYALAGAIFFLFMDMKPPAWIASTTEILGGMTVPIMLITLGISLSSLKIAGLKRGLFFSVVRLVMGFAVGLGVAEAFQLEGMQWGVVIVESAMPVAVFNYLFAMRYNNDPEEVAGMVVISTFISFATLPLLIWFVLG